MKKFKWNETVDTTAIEEKDESLTGSCLKAAEWIQTMRMWWHRQVWIDRKVVKGGGYSLNVCSVNAVLRCTGFDKGASKSSVFF